MINGGEINIFYLFILYLLIINAGTLEMLQFL